MTAELFEQQRPRLFAIAYRMLGSASEAEDVLQDTFVRYIGVQPDAILDPGAYLSTIVTRLCLDRLKSARATREQYLGPWLPEPILTPHDDPQETAERHETVTLAFLVLLERLTPAERAVFVLRDVFEYPYAEVAAILQLSEANCRQLLHRAKAQIAAHRARFSAPAARHQALVECFLTATERGDVAGLIQLLAEDVVFEADSGGKAQAPLRPVQGAASVAKLMPIYLANVVRLVAGDRGAIRSHVATVNGELAVLTWIRDQLDSITVLSITDDRISALRLIRNPEKLQHVHRQLQLDAGALS